MRVNITADHIRLSSYLQKLIDRKIGTSLEKYLPQFNQEIKTATLKISRHTRFGYEAVFNLSLPKKVHVRAQSHQKTLIKTLIQLRNEIKRQLRRYHRRLTDPTA